MSNSRTQLVLSCMDRRHTGALLPALQKVGILEKFPPYEVRIAGGASLLASLSTSSRKEFLLEQLQGAIALGVNELILTVHGIGKEDAHGCGGYRLLAQLPQEGKTPEECEAFLSDELKQAEKVLRMEGIQIPIHLFVVTFSADGTNQLMEVTVDQPTSEPELVA